ncbi:hypothetical protein FACS1894192_00740 [Bacilli bacterium]|nr:hypothetical protein FACS1894192_00740 [Bacilli bacterium]
MIDKKTFNYKRALEETNSFHQIFGFALPVPIEYSLVIYTLLIFLIETIIWWRLLHFIPVGWAFALATLGAYKLGQYLSDLKIDGKKAYRYVKDELIYYFKYGRKKDKWYLNKGIMYRRGKL